MGSMSPRTTKTIASASKPAKSKGTKKKGDSPMMVQFWRAKKEAPDAILFFRMGDFYELFHEDAVKASRELGLTLTSRSKGADAIPMAGVPVRSVEGYIIRLVKKGHKVAICEQLQDPREVKGIVDRGIVRLVTPGTLTEESALDARTPNFLASLFVGRQQVGLAWIDLSTGRLMASEFPHSALADELARLRPAELLVSSGLLNESSEWTQLIHSELSIPVTEREQWRYDREGAKRNLAKHFGVLNLGGFGIEEDSEITPAAGALFDYVSETQKAACAHILGIERVSTRDRLILDRATRACLELVSTQRENRREGTLLDTIDATRTPMGSRLLRDWVLSPLVQVHAILARQHAVAELVEKPFLREELAETLADVVDIERLVGRIATGRCNGRDLVSLATSMGLMPSLLGALKDADSDTLQAHRTGIDPLEDLTESISSTLVDEPPLTLKEGNLVRDGFSAELDELRTIAGDAKSWMARFQAEESERSNIPGLKIGYNSVFGYFIEVPRGQASRVPEHYVRKQTIKSAERYITPDLKEFEGKVLKSEELSRDLEYKIFQKLRDDLASEIRRVLETARTVAEIDVLVGLAQTAAENHYVAPSIDDGPRIHFVEGRHPVIELSPSCETFVPNDCTLDHTGERITILTGPNMAGKSTYIRQTALIVLLAQMGSFVPAQEAHIGVVDRIFTRVGAGDDISRGESTFMVEMVEIANILNNASRRSLVVLDEVGRGTSTFDGLSLAWSIAEHLHESIGCRTLFATHYHQLTDLCQSFDGVVNKNVAVRESGDEIVFLHKIVSGGTDRSYGIHVARLAGVPHPVLERAKAILADIEADEEDLSKRILSGDEDAQASSPPKIKAKSPKSPTQLGLFVAPPSEAEETLRNLDIDLLTPIDALLQLRELKSQLESH